MHDSARVHVIQCTAELDKVAPDGLLRNQLLLLLEVLHGNETRGKESKAPTDNYTWQGSIRPSHIIK